MVVPQKDIQTVEASGRRIAPLLEGVVVHRLTTHPDERGSLTELFHPAWVVPKTVVAYVELITVRPDFVKGWVKHQFQDDCMTLVSGSVLIVLFDDRPESATYHQVCELFFTPENRSLVHIPANVYHALKNVGIEDACLVNMPNNAYNHAEPDKLRLPIENDLIPYTWR